MHEERPVVAQLKNFLVSQPEDVPEELAALADDYASLCHRLNERLKRCEEHLRNGMRAEALHLAEQDPPVLEVAAVLEFHGVEAWHEFCHRSNHSGVPPTIAIETVDWLNKAYVQEQPVAELVAQYRRLTLSGASLPQKISTLRDLVERDVENAKHWRSDLDQFECTRLRELASQLQHAARSNDLTQLQALQAELQYPEWLTKPDPRLLEKVERELHRVRVLMASHRGKQIAKQAWDAYSEFNVNLADKALKAWNALLEEGFFSPEEDLVTSIEEVRVFVAEDRRKHSEERGFEQAQRTLDKAIHEDWARSELQRLIEEVEKYERPWPKLLHTRATRAIDDALLQEARARKQLITVCAIILIAVGLGVFFFVRSSINAERANEWALQIEAARTAHDYADAKSLLEKLGETYPNIASRDPFPTLEKTIEREHLEFEEQRKKCAELLQRYESLRAKGFPEGEPYASIESEIERIMFLESERQKLDELKLAYKTDQERRQEERDEKFRGHLNALHACDAELDTMNPELESDKYKKTLYEMSSKLGVARAQTRIDPGLYDQLPLLGKRYQSKREHYENTTERITRRRRMLAEIDNARPPLIKLDEYANRVDEFIKAFPDFEDRARFERIVKDCGLGMDLVRGDEFAGPFNQIQEKLKQFIESPEASHSVWEKVAQWIRKENTNVSDSSLIRGTLEALKGNRRFSELRELQGREKNGGRVLYHFYDEPKELKVTRLNDQIRVEYEVKVLDANETATETKISLDSLIPADPTETLAPHAAWIYKVDREIRRPGTQSIVEIVLQRLEELKKDERVDPVVKVILLSMFMKEIRKMISEGTGQMDSYIRILDDVDTNVPWMSPVPDLATVRSRKSAQEALDEIKSLPIIAHRQKFLNSVYSLALSRGVRFVDVVDLDETGALKITPGRRYPELWIVTGQRGTMPKIYVAAVADANGNLEVLPSVKDRFYQGQPLFSPSDGKGTGLSLNGILRHVSEDQRERLLLQFPWPALWPENVRTMQIRRDN